MNSSLSHNPALGNPLEHSNRALGVVDEVVAVRNVPRHKRRVVGKEVEQLVTDDAAQ
jgi:hypothetical protein